MQNKLRILLVDDHQIVLDGLRALLSEEPSLDISDAQNGREAIQFIEMIGADLVLMDIDMPVMNGLEATLQLKAKHPKVKIIILSMHSEQALIKKTIQFGAEGYLLKNTSKAELLEAIHSVMEGKTPFISKEIGKLSPIHSPIEAGVAHPSETLLLAQLTDREVEIIRLIAQGLTNKEIGEQLFISHRTVDTHRTHIMKKLDVTNLAGLVRFAFRNGLLEEN
jgi:two-component system response regulator NreC